MTTKIIMHHVQEVWFPAMEKYLYSLDEYLDAVSDFLGAFADNDTLIVTNFEERELTDFQRDAVYRAGVTNPEVHEYGYGWDESFLYENEEIGDGLQFDYAPGGSHSDIVWLPDWLKSLKKMGDRVILFGAFAGECVEDMQTALYALDIPFITLWPLVVGMNGADIDRAYELINNLENLDDLYNYLEA